MMRRDPFQAIADPNRRAILALIARESMNLNTVASHFSVSRPAISKHIKILRQCGLVEIRQKGRERYCEARLERLSEVVMWLEDYRSQWSTEIQTVPVSIPAAPKEEQIVESVPVNDTNSVHIPAGTVIATEVEMPDGQEEVIEETVISAVDGVLPPDAIAGTKEVTVLSTEEVTLTQDTAITVAENKKTGLVPWEEGYDEAADTLVPDTTEEVSLSADAVASEVPNAQVLATEENHEEEAKVTVESDPQPEPEITSPIIPVTNIKPSRKKKSPPPADTLQGSLF